MKADLLFCHPEKVVFSQYPLLTTPHRFLFRFHSNSHTLTCEACVDSERFHLPSSAQLESSETRSCGLRIRELAKTILGESSGQVSSLSKVQIRSARQKQL